MGEINSKLPEEIKFSRSNILTDALNRPVKSFSSADTTAVSKLPKKYPSVDNLSRYCDASTKHSTPLTNRCFSDNIDKISRPVVNNKNINLDVKKIFKPKRTERENNDEVDNPAVASHNEDQSKKEKIRNTYFAKLIYKNMLTSKKEKTHNTVFIFDWDDTLLCTTFLTPKGYYDEKIPISDKAKEKMLITQEYAFNLLNLCLKKGTVYIITNSGVGWVEFSSKKFLPKIYPLLKRIKIISARGMYEKNYPGNTRMWKILAFSKLLEDLDTKLVTNLICVGDSLIEIEAGENLANHFDTAFIKTVKFRESPKIDELNKQLKLVNDEFNIIYASAKNLSIRVEKKQKESM